jgi:hypothetical protein
MCACGCECESECVREGENAHRSMVGRGGGLYTNSSGNATEMPPSGAFGIRSTGRSETVVSDCGMDGSSTVISASIRLASTVESATLSTRETWWGVEG